jgi:hypothetical protein
LAERVTKNRALVPAAFVSIGAAGPAIKETGMPKRNNRRLMLDIRRAIPFCLGIWLAPPVIGTPTLELVA